MKRTTRSRTRHLRRQAAFFRDLSPVAGCTVAFDHLPNVRVVIKDRDGRFVWVSANVPARHGFRDPGEMIGLDDRDINPLSMAEIYWRDDQRVMESGEPLLAKTEIAFNEAGLPDWFVVNKLPLRDRRGGVCGLIATISPHDGLTGVPVGSVQVRHAMALIKAQLASPLRLHSIARAVGLSARQLQRHVLLATGLTISETILRCRVAEACRLLRDTTLPVGQIAIQVGFYDQSALNRAFGRYVPLRPLEYRRAHARTVSR